MINCVIHPALGTRQQHCQINNNCNTSRTLVLLSLTIIFSIFVISMTSSLPSLVFTVRRCQPELVPPAAPTPHEVKLLSDIDDQLGVRFHVPLIHIYHQEPSMADKDPVNILRTSLAQTLVYYYPLAGRLREGAGRKLMVDCTGEGVMFVEAEADVTLDQFGDDLQPPFPCFQKLLYDIPEEIINTPLLYIQVTRLKCGGFILAYYLSHTMCDAAGLKQFLNAWTEMARGACQPSILPVWHRELLMARDPPRITCNHHEYEQVPSTTTEEATTVNQSFFLGPPDIAVIRRLIPFHLRERSSTFDIITACFWRCRTKALQLKPDEEVRMMCVVNGRARFNPPLPLGYYGNGFAFPAAVTTVGKLCGNPLGYAVELIRKAKAEVTEEYMRSVADLMVIKDRCLFTAVNSCIVSDLTRAGFREPNFGWGEALYAGVAKGGGGSFSGITYLVPHKNTKGEEGILFPVCLPSQDMKRFAKELDDMIGNQNQSTTCGPSSIMSSM